MRPALFGAYLMAASLVACQGIQEVGPRIIADPPAVDFGEVDRTLSLNAGSGLGKTQTVRIANLGDLPVDLGQARLSGTLEAESWLEIDLDQLPRSLEPGAVAELEVSWAELPPDAVAGTYTVNLVINAASTGEASAGCSPRLVPAESLAAVVLPITLGVVDRCDEDGDGAVATWCGGDDCDDRDAEIHPGAEERCNGIDDDCDGELGPGEVDADGDGFRGCEGDCEDTVAEVYPGALEICDGLDNDCDGLLLEGESDPDGDGWLTCEGDCGPEDPATYPGAAELCDGLDNDCDTVVPSDELDADGDGLASCAGDCDDLDPLTYLGAFEACDGLDNDCDGVVDDGVFADADSDG